jgi:hypothetical protein
MAMGIAALNPSYELRASDEVVAWMSEATSGAKSRTDPDVASLIRATQLLHAHRRRNREALWCACTAFQSDAAAAAGLNTLAEVLDASVQIILSALDTFFLGKSNIG